MGVPNFFTWLIKEHPEIIKFDQNKKVDSLYFDWTSAIFLCANEVISNSTDSANLIEKKIINETLKYLDYLVSLIKPTKLIYIALDGVPTRAKMNQQRLSKFKQTKERRQLNQLKSKYNKPINPVWDFNSITPGTSFLQNLGKSTIQHIKKYNNLQVIVSTAQEPLEAKDKIINHLRKTKHKSIFIYGSDIQLIFSGMSCLEKDVFLLSANKTNLKLDFIDVKLLRQKLINYIENKTNYYPKNKQVYIDDFIVLSFLLGNDYLPPIPTLLYQHHGLERLLDNYINTQKRLKFNLVHPRTKEINIKFLINMLKPLADNETAQFQENYKKERYITGKAPKHITGFDKEIYEYNLLAQERQQDQVQLGKSNWKSRYYRHYFNIEENDKNSIYQICKAFIQGINWLWKYYKFGIPSWDWYYPFHQAPHLSDLIYIIRQVNVNKFKFKKNIPLKTFEQLLAVLPSESQHLAPKKYQSLFDSNSSPIGDFYPIDFRQDFIQKVNRLNGIPMIPFVNIKRLIAATKGLQLTKEEKDRNLVLNAFDTNKRRKPKKM